ncbi:MAG: DUF2868 domain-containing protein [Burkholderiales bacterium]
MDERTALAVTAVRAVETADRAHADWTDADRAWASRAAAEVVGEAAAPEVFVGRRATLALERLASRKHRVARLARAWQWRSWVGTAAIVAAFLLGALSDAIGPSERINILAPPVAALVVWNLVVYALLASRFVVRYGEPGAGPIARVLTRIAGGARSAGRAADPAVAAFAGHWAQASQGLYAARAARVLHLAAAALAIGVIAGLYVRGLGLEYRATWESTFLEPSAVRAWVAAIYAPGAFALGVQVPEVARIAAIRAPGSENAALWLHLMAATLVVIVILPRAVLALIAWIAERYRGAHLLDELRGGPADAYFTRLLRGFRASATAVAVVPYSFTLGEEAQASLQSLLDRAMGGHASLAIAPSVAYGREDDVRAPAGEIAVALFNAASTPEQETHSRFLAALASARRPLLVLVDESAIAARAGGDAARIESRRALWREVAPHAVFVDLAQPDTDAIEGDVERALEALASEVSRA